MATAARRAHGTLLKIHDGTSTYTTIAEVLDITGGGYEIQTEDATSHDSGGWAEVAPTLKDGGEITFDLLYSSAATQDTFETDALAMTFRLWQIVMTPATGVTDTRSFGGYVTKVEVQAPVAGLLRMSCTIKVSGAVTKTIS